MIPHEVFERVWKRLCVRFNRSNDDPELAAEYYEYLNVRLSEEEFQAAAASLWASREFFPRPADFLMTKMSNEWRALTAFVRVYSPPTNPGTDEWDRLGLHGQEAVRILGGMRAVKDAFNKNPGYLRRDFEGAYAQSIAQNAAETPLIAPTERAAVGGAVQPERWLSDGEGGA